MIQSPHLVSLPLTAASKPLPSPHTHTHTHTHRFQDPCRIQFKTHFLDDRKPVKNSNQNDIYTEIICVGQRVFLRVWGGQGKIEDKTAGLQEFHQRTDRPFNRYNVMNNVKTFSSVQFSHSVLSNSLRPHESLVKHKT